MFCAVSLRTLRQIASVTRAFSELTMSYFPRHCGLLYFDLCILFTRVRLKENSGVTVSAKYYLMCLMFVYGYCKLLYWGVLCYVVGIRT